ncbi:putative secondary metabolism biosynthetic enzyme [Leucoagaricus gongylophorus]
MLLGIGVDIVYLPRIAAIVKRYSGHNFASRILSKRELEQWNCLQDTSEQRQIQWAVKEAAYKALYPDIKPTWKELTYLGLSPYGEKPTLSYGSPSQNSGKKFGSMHVSVSHDGDYTVAYVAVERNTGTTGTLDNQFTGSGEVR